MVGYLFYYKNVENNRKVYISAPLTTRRPLTKSNTESSSTFYMKKNLNNNDIRFLTNLYWTQTTYVQQGQDETNEIQVQREVRQECVLSHCLNLQLKICT